jgi:siroheme synthase
MAVRHVAKIAARLSDSGLSPDTPTAVIESATLPSQRVLVGGLSDIGRVAEEAAVRGPAVVVVGEVVRRVNPAHKGGGLPAALAGQVRQEAGVTV